MSLGGQLVRFGLVGIANTMITAAIILGLTILKVDLVAANAAGFAAGLANSYYFNRRYTFRAQDRRVAFSFLCSFVIAYVANLAIVLLTDNLPNMHSLASQAFGIVTYNIIFFTLMKLWVFAGGSKSSKI